MRKVFENFSQNANKVLDNIKENLIPLIKDSELPENSTKNVLNSGINFYKREERIYFEKCVPNGEPENLLTINPLKNTFCISTKSAVKTNPGEKFSLKQAFVKQDDGKKDFYIGYYPSRRLFSPSGGVSDIGLRSWDTYFGDLDLLETKNIP